MTEKFLARYKVIDAETLLLYASSGVLRPWALSVAEHVSTATDSELRDLVARDGLPLARTVAQTMMARGDVAATGATWVHGAAWFAELSKEGTAIQPPSLTEADIERRIRFFAEAAPELARLTTIVNQRSHEVVLRSLRDSYKGHQKYFYDHITARAVAAATAKPGQNALLGCAIIFAVLAALGTVVPVVAAITEAVFGSNTTASGIALVVALIIAVGAIIWIAIIISTYTSRQSRERYHDHYYRTWNQLAAEQKVLELSLGVS
jgi:hypothetical protein